jgi:hypothetical protein
MNLAEVLFAVEDHWVCSTLDLSEAISELNTKVWTKRIYSGNGCGGCTNSFSARDDLKIFDGCADDLLVEQSK